MGLLYFEDEAKRICVRPSLSASEVERAKSNRTESRGSRAGRDLQFPSLAFFPLRVCRLCLCQTQHHTDTSFGQCSDERRRAEKAVLPWARSTRSEPVLTSLHFFLNHHRPLLMISILASPLAILRTSAYLVLLIFHVALFAFAGAWYDVSRFPFHSRAPSSLVRVLQC